MVGGILSIGEKVLGILFGLSLMALMGMYTCILSWHSNLTGLHISCIDLDGFTFLSSDNGSGRDTDKEKNNSADVDANDGRSASVDAGVNLPMPHNVTAE